MRVKKENIQKNVLAKNDRPLRKRKRGRPKKSMRRDLITRMY